MFRDWLGLMGWALITLGVFACASPFLPKKSAAQEDANHALIVLIGIGLVLLGIVLARKFHGRDWGRR